MTVRFCVRPPILILIAIAAEIAAHNAKGPHILSDEIKNNLEQPLVGLDLYPTPGAG